MIEKLTTLPNKNDVLIVDFAMDKCIWYVHSVIGNHVLIGPRNWQVMNFNLWSLKDLNNHNASIVGRCIRIWPFRFFKFN